MKMKIESLYLQADGSVLIGALVTYAFGMVERTTVRIDKASWEKCVDRARHWHAS